MAAQPAEAPTAGSSQAPPAPVDADYLIGPGDTLQVFVWQNPDLSISNLQVRPDGKISTPLVEDMVANGKSASQLARDIEKALAVYIRSPAVNVIVTNALSVGSQVKVVGQAVTPKALPFKSGMTVMDVVIEVGGLGQFAAGNRAKIVRQEANGKTREIKVRLFDLLEKGDMRQNIKMQPGDVLIIPETRF
jgi:polysaccharide export outer membrane protein